jgi:hypothetical protein
MLQVRFHLGALESLAAVGLGLFIAIVAVGGQLFGTLCLAFGDALRLGLLVRSSFRFCLGLGLGSLLDLLALNFRILGGVPGVENLREKSAFPNSLAIIWEDDGATYITVFGLFVVELATADSTCRWRGRRGGRVRLLFVCVKKRSAEFRQCRTAARPPSRTGDTHHLAERSNEESSAGKQRLH